MQFKPFHGPCSHHLKPPIDIASYPMPIRVVHHVDKRHWPTANRIYATPDNSIGFLRQSLSIT